jgi:hypothetical protein
MHAGIITGWVDRSNIGAVDLAEFAGLRRLLDRNRNCRLELVQRGIVVCS